METEEVVETKKKTAKKAAPKEKAEKKTKAEEKDSAADKLAKLKEKAKALEGKFKDSDEKIDIKKEVKGEKEEKKDMLVPIDDYLKSSIHLGTRVITPHMKNYVYRRRADGLAVFNTDLVDDKIKEAAEYLAQFSPEQIVIACKREAGWKATKRFSEILGIKSFTKKYPAGTLTNTNLSDFFERDLLVICDPWLDKNALVDANKTKMKVLSICDTNNYTFGIDFILPGNNKSAKSLGMILYLLARLYSEKRNMKVEMPPVEDFIEDWSNATIPN